jgi:hypothetical protein
MAWIMTRRSQDLERRRRRDGEEEMRERDAQVRVWVENVRQGREEGGEEENRWRRRLWVSE